MSQLSFSSSKDYLLCFKPVVQTLKVKGEPLQVSAVVPHQPSKVQPSKKQTGLNLKQAKTVTKTFKPTVLLKSAEFQAKAFWKLGCFIPLPDDGLRPNGLREE